MSADRTSTVTMLLLSAGTGVLDAATYLGLHGVFTANMTGNVIFIGLGLAGGNDIPLLRSLLAFAGFVVGALAGGLLQRNREVRANADVIATVLFGLATLLVAGSAVGLQVLSVDPGVLDVFTVALAFAMGVQAVGARRVGVADVSTVVVTSTLAGLAADGPLTGNRTGHGVTGRRLAAVLSMGAGAVAGAFLLRAGIVLPIAVSAAVLLVVTVVSGVRAVRDRRAPQRQVS